MRAREQITVIHAIEHVTDGRKCDIPDWDSATRTVCWAVCWDAGWSGSAKEQLSAGRDARLEGLTIQILGDYPVSALDRLECRGALWEILGNPALFVSPFSGKKIVTITAKRVEG